MKKRQKGEKESVLFVCFTFVKNWKKNKKLFSGSKRKPLE